MKLGRGVLRGYRDAPNVFARQLFAPLPHRYNLLAQVLSFGQDRRWHSVMVERVATDVPPLVLDVACGPCAETTRLASRTAARIVGVDLSEQMLLEGRKNVERAGCGDRVSLLVGRAEQLPFADATFDALMFTYLLRYVNDPGATLVELARVVKPGGVIVGLDFAVPTHRVWRAAWWCYCRTLLPLGGLILGGPAWWDAGRFLGPSISLHAQRYDVAWTFDAWRAAGIDDVQRRIMSLGGGDVMWGRRQA